jgi:hypothetical protein
VEKTTANNVLKIKKNIGIAGFRLRIGKQRDIYIYLFSHKKGRKCINFFIVRKPKMAH